MPEIFLGDLSKVKLFDILKPLLSGEKTGILSIKGKENGAICFNSGNIVHAKIARSSGEEAFFNIMEMRMGRVSFEPGLLPPEKTISIPTENLVINWSYRKQEWEKIREVIPSSKTIYRLSLHRDSGDKNISANQWEVLALNNGVRTVSEVAETLNWDELTTSKMIYQLFQAGLLEKVEGSRPLEKKLAGEDFFLTVEGELKKAVGPVAPIIIEDKLSEFGETKDSFPQDQALPFIEALGAEIPRDLRKKEFIKAMTEVLTFGK